MGKNVPKKNTVVIKILDFKRDWIAVVPDKYERDIALQKQGSSWAKFTAYASATNLVNNRVNMSIENYFKFIAASGFDPDKYEDKDANPADYIKHVNPNCSSYGSKKPTKAVKPAPVEEEAVISDVVKVDSLSAPEVSKTLSHNSESTHGIISELSLKMTAFTNHLMMYMCALGISSDDVIADTGITHFRELRDKTTVMALFDYVTLSKYFIEKYGECTDADARDTFKQVAALFNDIYVTTLYFNDCVK